MSTTTNALAVFYPTRHAMHRPAKDYSDGLPPFDHLESPQRIDELLAGIQSIRDIDLHKTDELALDAVHQLHDQDYVEFLLKISETITPGQEYIPPCFATDLKKSPLAFQGGMYCREVGTPIGTGTIKAALNSAHAAQSAAQHILASKQNTVALCRPPGHHAGKRRYGGYSYFNNAYLATKILNQQGKCAVLDVDYHIGDGSLEFAHANAPYFSLHANPYNNYPYLDATQALPTEHIDLAEFPIGIKGDEYLELLEQSLNKIKQQSIAFLILSLGFDTLGTDYIQDEYIYLVPDDYRRIVEQVKTLNVPILVLLEGGYDLPNLYDCGQALAKGM